MERRTCPSPTLKVDVQIQSKLFNKIRTFNFHWKRLWDYTAIWGSGKKLCYTLSEYSWVPNIGDWNSKGLENSWKLNKLGVGINGVGGNSKDQSMGGIYSGLKSTNLIHIRYRPMFNGISWVKWVSITYYMTNFDFCCHRRFKKIMRQYQF